MGKVIDLTKRKFGRLEVIRQWGRNKNGTILWLCNCVCGGQKIVAGNSLRHNGTRSCGCLNREQAAHNIQPHYKEIHETGIFRAKLNCATYKGSKTKVKGVCPHTGGYMAQIGFHGKNIYLGWFKNIDNAILARKAAEEKYFKPILAKCKEKKEC